MVSEILKKTKRTLGSRSGGAEADGLSGKFSGEAASGPKPYWNQWFPGAPGPEISSSAARLKEFRDPGTVLNLPHLNTSGNTHGESIMIDLARA
jgi:hypothetical protein